jgi:hypothetical protein
MNYEEIICSVCGCCSGSNIKLSDNEKAKFSCPSCAEKHHEMTKKHYLGHAMEVFKNRASLNPDLKAAYEKEKTVYEAVNHPNHYQSDCGLEAIDVIEAFNLNFCLGNAVKYILRAGNKGWKREDLEKAIWYIEREIDNVEES